MPPMQKATTHTHVMDTNTMSDLRELGTAPEPYRTRADEPEPIRVFTGYFNGNQHLSMYRAHLVRYKWHKGWNGWFMPDSCWGVSLCDRDAYPYRWKGLLAHPQSGSESYVPEVADMELCRACEKVLERQQG